MSKISLAARACGWRTTSYALGCALTLLAGTAHAADLSGVSRAVVKLYISQHGWDIKRPWNKGSVDTGSCSGFFIAEGILTNAHCVTDATYIQVEIPGVPDKLEAERVVVNHQVDLAILRLIDQEGAPAITPIAFADLPELRDKVVTIGYPVGGREVTYTEGVVSRIDMMPYLHSRISGLLVQADAAINAGSSGGPVFSNESGACVGVAVQKGSGSSIGYFIPTPVIRQFLLDARDGRVDGIPYLGVELQDMENPSLREYLKMKPDQTGMRVLRLPRDGSAHGVLQEDDVILAIDGHRVYNDGRAPFRDGGKIGMGYYITGRQIGEELTVRLLRDGEERTVKVALASPDYWVIPRMPAYDTQPRYYVIGGMVFQVVEPRYFGKTLPFSIESVLYRMRGEEAGLEELVVLSDVYETEINKGYKGFIDRRVNKVNGKRINRLADLVEAFAENTEGRYHVIEFGKHRAVLDRAQVAAGEAAIRARYNIR